MDTKHGSRIATRRVGLIVTVLVAALMLGACGTGGDKSAAPAPATAAAGGSVVDTPVGDTAKTTVGGVKADETKTDTKANTKSIETKAKTIGAAADGSAPTKNDVLHRYGEVTAPGAGTGSWDSMEEFMDFVIQDANGYWQWIFWDYGIPAPSVNYYFPAPGESIDTSCGATDDDTAFYCPDDDLIVISQQLAVELWDGDYHYADRDVDGYNGDMAVAFVVAHEFAHSLQSELGFLDNYSTLGTEIHADCWAGVWASSANDWGMLDAGDVDEALATAWLVGSTAGEQRDHGDSQERMDAFTQGFDTGLPLMCGDYLNR